MSAETTLYGWLSTYAPLTSSIGTRIFPDVVPLDQQLPAVAYARTATEPVVTIHGTKPAEFVTLVVQCWAQTRPASEALADKVAAALATHGEVPTARSALFDPEIEIFGTSLDVRLLI